MAGIRDTLERLRELVEASLPEYRYTKQDVYTLLESMPSGFDRTFSIALETGGKVNPVHSNITQSLHTVKIEIAREHGGGDATRYDKLSIYEDIEESAMVVMENIDLPSNWDYPTTGLILLTIDQDSSGIEAEENAIIYTIMVSLTIRRTSTHQEVA